MQRNNDKLTQMEEQIRALLAADEVQPPDFDAQVLIRMAREPAHAEGKTQPVAHQAWLQDHRLLTIFPRFLAWCRARMETMWLRRQPLHPDWQSWTQTLADAVLGMLNTSDSDILRGYATSRASFSKPPLEALRLSSRGRTSIASRGNERAGPSDVLSLIEEEVIPFLWACEAGGSPAARVRSLTPAQRALLVERLERGARCLGRSRAEEDRLIAAFTCCLLGETRVGKGESPRQ